MGEARLIPNSDIILEFMPTCFRPQPALTHDQWVLQKTYVGELPHWSRIRQYDKAQDSRVVWELQVKAPHELFLWRVYGGFHSESLYPPGVLAD